MKYVFCGLAEASSPQITKRLGPQIAIPQSVIFAEGPRILQIIQVRKFGDLRLAELICGRPTIEKQGSWGLLD